LIGKASLPKALGLSDGYADSSGRFVNLQKPIDRRSFFNCHSLSGGDG